MDAPTTPQKLGIRPAMAPGSRRRRKVPSKLARGLKKPVLSVAATAAKVKELLQLPFDPETWQAELIHKIQTGYDDIAIAGTGDLLWEEPDLSRVGCSRWKGEGSSCSCPAKGSRARSGE